MTYRPLTSDEIAAHYRAEHIKQNTCPACEQGQIEWEGTAFPEDYCGDVYGECDSCDATLVSGDHGIQVAPSC